MLSESQKPQSAKWKLRFFESNKLFNYFNKTPALEQGLKEFVLAKLKILRNLKPDEVITPRTLSLGMDAGRFHRKELKKFDHYHINMPGGKLYVLIYVQIIDPITKTLTLQLTSVVHHKQYESANLIKSLGKTLSDADYKQIGVMESKKRLFSWLFK